MNNDEIVVREDDRTVDVTGCPIVEQSSVVFEQKTAEISVTATEAVVVRDDDAAVDVATTLLDTVVVEGLEQPVDVIGPSADAAVTVASRDVATIEVVGPGATLPSIVDVVGRFNVLLSGAKDGVNKRYTTPDPFIASTFRLYVNGLRKTPGLAYDFVVIGPSTIDLAWAPKNGDQIMADYLRQT